jgi:hypothetical protein
MQLWVAKLFEQKLPPEHVPPHEPYAPPHGTGSMVVVVVVVVIVVVVVMVVGVVTVQWPPAGHEQSLPHVGPTQPKMTPCRPQTELASAPHV